MELREAIEQFMINYGLISIFIIVALEYANAPLPSEIVLPLAGIFAHEYNMGFINVVIVSIVGGIVGALINYYIGLWLGNSAIELISSKYPKTKKSIRASYEWIKKYDKLSVFLTRIVPMARTIISIVAGAIRMNVVTFTIYSVLGISIWNIVLIAIGYIVGDNISLITSILTQYSYIVSIIIIIGIAIFGFKKYIYKKKSIDK